MESTVTFQLPAPFDQIVELGAQLDRGDRQISWTIREPGKIAGNAFVYAWFDVTERQPMKGEPLWFAATRRRGENHMRESFTDKGREHLAAIVLPAIARYGFDRLWTEIHSAASAGVDYSGRIAAAEAALAWFRTASDLAEMHGLGLLDFKPPTKRADGRGYRVKVYGHDGHTDYVDVVADAYLGDEKIGYLVRYGEIVPIDPDPSW